MNLACGIIGLPNAGKSTLFNALLARQAAEVKNYPFSTIEPNTGIVEVPNYRLKKIAKIAGSQKIVSSTIKFIDIAGLVKGASQGEGLGNQFLAHIREVDLIIHVIRAFDNNQVIRSGGATPREDYEIIQTELCLADLATLEKQKEPKGATDKKEKKRWQIILRLRQEIAKGKPARLINLSEDELTLIKDLRLISLKKELVVFNVSENNLLREISPPFLAQASESIAISAKIESELGNFSQADRKSYLQSLGVESSALEQLIKKAHQKLDLIDFLTANEKEAHAWTIKKGTLAKAAAGAVHSDFEAGFIRAGVANLADFVKYNGWKGLKEAGKIRFEGKDYQIKDGDIIQFYVAK